MKKIREWTLEGNGGEPHEQVNPLQFKAKANAFYDGPLLKLGEKVKVVEKSVYDELKLRFDKTRHQLR